MPGLTELKLFADDTNTLDPDTWAPDGLSGTSKPATRYIYGLLTPAGSVPGRPNDGTTFIDDIRTFRSEFDIFAAFAANDAAAAATARAAEVDDDPDSEKLGWARLAGVEVNGDSVTITLTVSSADGSRPADPVRFSVTL